MTITNLKCSAAVCCLLLVVSFTLGHPSVAHAGILDRLKAAAAQAAGKQPASAQQTSTTQQPAASNGADPDHPLHLTGEGHCHGHESATCLDYMDLMNQCMAPMKGYYAKLMAERIDWRLTHDDTLRASRRENLEEDRAAFRDLAAKKSDDEPTLGAVPHSQRFLSDIADEDAAPIPIVR